MPQARSVSLTLFFTCCSWLTVPKRPATAGKRGLDLIHAVEAQHLLVEVDLARQVGAECRRRDRKRVGVLAVFHLAAQTAEDLHDEVAGDVRAHHRVEARDAGR